MDSDQELNEEFESKKSKKNISPKSEDSSSENTEIQPIVKMSLIGNIEPFSFDGQSDLSEYLSRMEHIFKVNKIEEELKIS